MTAPLLLRLVADDLSGAAEAAGVLKRHGFAATVVLDGPVPGAAVSVEDLHVRNAGAAAAARIAVSIRAGELPDYIKIDSQLRGPVRELIDAAARVGAVVVLAPALPALGRTVRNAVPLLDDLPLAEAPGSAWLTEASRAPGSLDELVPDGLAARHASVDDVHSGSFAHALSTSGKSVVHLADAGNAEDLRAIALAIQHCPHQVVPVGSSGLLAALLAESASECVPVLPRSYAERVVLVLGSLEPVVLQQRAALGEPSVVVTAIAGETSDTLAARIAAALDGATRVVVVTASPSRGVHDPTVAQLLGSATAGAIQDRPDVALGLIGGETARCTLEALGDLSLDVHGEVHPGAVLSSASGQRLVVTRPGAFGGEDSLRRILSTLLGDPPRMDHQKVGLQ